MSGEERKSIGRILLEQKALSPAQLDAALAQQKKSALPLASQLTEQGVITELDALKALSTQRGVPGIDLNQVCIKLSDLNVLPREIATRHKLLPVLEREDRIFCAMANPEDKKALEELEFVTGKRIFAYIALDRALLRVIRDAYDLKDRARRSTSDRHALPKFFSALASPRRLRLRLRQRPPSRQPPLRRPRPLLPRRQPRLRASLRPCPPPSGRR